MNTRTIAFANQKGGVGKTTTAVSVAACLAELGKRVLLVDLDPQANATSALGLQKLQGGSVYQALLGEEELAASIQSTAYQNLSMIPSEVDLAVAEVDVARAENYLHRFRRALQPIHESNRFDFILVDCPPSLGILTMNALAAADRVIVPIQCEYFALEGLAVILRVIQQIHDSGVNPGLELSGIVMTMFDGRTNLAQQVLEEVKKHFGSKLYKITIPRTVRLAEAPSFGKPITQYDAGSYAAWTYRQLTEEILEREAPKPAEISGVSASSESRAETMEGVSPPS